MRIGWLPPWVVAPPGRCAVCGAWPARPLCAGCTARFGTARHRCGRCALVLPEGVRTCGACVREPPPLDACFAAVDYAFPWSGLVHRFKFRGEPGWAATLARHMAAIPGVAEEIAQADLLLPMPLARGRLAERGFNQALLLARRLGGRKVDGTLLLRLRETGAQAALDRAARRRNVEGAFGLEPLRADAVRGKRVLLVDDVMTSGASLHAVARVLRQAGTARVAAVVLARTDAPG
ncbi:ComF family protein [Ramlibacter monticola]|uniref:ComF family protein n=1 Tax=Ramlibacter monticola TaxID=1926872 RepID=A0A936Z475_9BURK|nr:ComF family protein [Ramlibacter monticola]MBL0393310.1 ComF family protein [Ramlibacter monticola]